MKSLLSREKSSLFALNKSNICDGKWSLTHDMWKKIDIVAKTKFVS